MQRQRFQYGSLFFGQEGLGRAYTVTFCVPTDEGRERSDEGSGAGIETDDVNGSTPRRFGGGGHHQSKCQLRQTAGRLSALLCFRAECSIVFHSVFIQFFEGLVEIADLV